MKKEKRGREIKYKRWYQIAAGGQSQGVGGRSRTRRQSHDGRGVAAKAAITAVVAAAAAVIVVVAVAASSGHTSSRPLWSRLPSPPPVTPVLAPSGNAGARPRP